MFVRNFTRVEHKPCTVTLINLIGIWTRIVLIIAGAASAFKCKRAKVIEVRRTRTLFDAVIFDLEGVDLLLGSLEAVTFDLEGFDLLLGSHILNFILFNFIF